jgi:hypothetical protein
LRKYCRCGKAVTITYSGRSQWLCGLRRWSAAACWLGLRVRIPPMAWMSVVIVVLSDRGLCDRAYQSYRGVLPVVMCLNKCDHEASIMRRPWCTRGCWAIEKRSSWRRPYLYLKGCFVLSRSAFDMYPGSAWFETRLGHCLTLFVVPLNPVK